MDPFSVIVMLAIHLIGSGGLMFLVWRLMPDAPGLGRWSLASTLFGLAYLARLFAGLNSVDAVSLVSDAVMLLSVLLFNDGVREFVGHKPLRVRSLLTLCATLAAVEAVALALGGAQARHVVLNLVIGAIYALMVQTLCTQIKGQRAPLRGPLWLLTALLGGLALMTLLRAFHIGTQGMQVAFHGALAQAFYVYASLAAVVIALTLLWILFLRLNGQLADLATRDALTGVFNRNGLAQALKAHFDRRDAPPLTLLLADIDHFKRINDTLGHPTGDAVLQAVANALLSELRAGDFVARIGGEEFLIGCVGAQPDVALGLAQRLRRCVSQLAVPSAQADRPIACTVSVGVSACFTDYASWEAAAAQADAALYRAKAAGRDGVQPFLA